MGSCCTAMGRKRWDRQWGRGLGIEGDGSSTTPGTAEEGGARGVR
jgi:hypothetical protein